MNPLKTLLGIVLVCGTFVVYSLAAFEIYLVVCAFSAKWLAGR